MAPARTSATARAAAASPPSLNPATAPEPAPVYAFAMDTYVPIIPDSNPDNIEQRFKHPTLSTIENQPDYEQMCVVREELFRNEIVIKSTFGGKRHGHPGSVQQLAVYHTEAGQFLNLADIISREDDGK